MGSEEPLLIKNKHHFATKPNLRCRVCLLMYIEQYVPQIYFIYILWLRSTQTQFQRFMNCWDFNWPKSRLIVGSLLSPLPALYTYTWTHTLFLYLYYFLTDLLITTVFFISWWLICCLVVSVWIACFMLVIEEK